MSSAISYKVEHRENCILIYGDIPMSAFPVLVTLAPENSVAHPDVARMYGANFAFGLPADLLALHDEMAPHAERAARMAHPSLSDGAVKWLANGHRGLSSDAMFTVLTGVDATRDGWGAKYHPADPSDLDRCLKLLDAAPELRPKLPLMAKVSPAWAALIANWDQIEHSHLDEVGLGWTKARSAPKTYELMRTILKAAEGV